MLSFLSSDKEGGIGKVKRLNMGKAKEILRLNGQGFSYRDIASSVGCGKTVVGETLKRASAADIESADGYTEPELEKILFPEKYADNAGTDEPDMGYILQELSRKHVTRQLLWEEYKLDHPNGLMYSQFCERIKAARKANEIDYHKTHKGGEECETDWAGTGIQYFDMGSKEWRTAAIFVAVLPASAYPFAYAYPDQKSASWIDAHIRAFRFFGGTPRILIPDCAKTAVVTPDLYDPVLTKSYQEMASHYDITIIPARPGKPRDKNYVENTVGNVSRRIIAALRDERFTSIEEINAAIGKKLDAFIDQPFKKLPGSRRSAFEQIDKPVLRPLPKAHYELAYFKACKIGVNYHAEYDGFFYSIPYEHRGKECHIRATGDTIEVFVGGERVCTHVRHHSGNRYVTRPEHLPDQHKAVSEWNDERFISWAGNYGDNTVAYVTALLGSTEYSVQAYRACMGVLREAKTVSPEIVEAASGMALEHEQFSSRYFSLAIKKKIKETGNVKPVRVIEHENIRGAKAFAGGERNA
jgi:transposase